MPVIYLQFVFYPLVVFSFGWSLSILAGNWAKGSRFAHCSEEWREAAAKNARACATRTVMIGLVFLAMLFFGIALNRYLRWVMLALMMLLVLFHIAKLGAAVEFGSKKLPHGQRALLVPLLAPTALSLACCLFGCWWMFQVFRLFGL